MQQGPLAPRALPRFSATTGLAATVSPSLAFPVSPVIRATLLHRFSRWDEDGFSSCLACPCHRAVPTTPPKCHVASVSLRHVMLPSPDHSGLSLRINILSRPPLGSLALRPGDSLTIPWMALSVGFIRFVSSTVCNPSYGVSDYYPGGTPSH